MFQDMSLSKDLNERFRQHVTSSASDSLSRELAWQPLGVYLHSVCMCKDHGTGCVLLASAILGIGNHIKLRNVPLLSSLVGKSVSQKVLGSIPGSATTCFSEFLFFSQCFFHQDEFTYEPHSHID